MALGFGARKTGAAPPSRVLTASGVKLTARDLTSQGWSHTRQLWQPEGWDYWSLIPEVRFGTQFLAHAVSASGWSVAQVNNAMVTDDDSADPIPFDSDECDLPDDIKQAAREELARLPLFPGSPFVERLTMNMMIPGECYVHSYGDPATGVEHWAVRSLEELTFGGNGRVTLHEGPSRTREINPDDEDLVRLWKPDPRRAWLADSAMRPLLDVCEDVVLAGREIRAASRSRAASNGILLVPEGMNLRRNATDGSDGTLLSAASAGFVQALTEAMAAPLRNEGHAGAVMPIVVVGNPDDLKEFRHLTLERETSAEVNGRVEAGLKRIASGLDMPGEVVSGMGDANHWSAWMIDSATARYHIAPWDRTVADALTVGVLRPALRARDFDPVLVERIQAWYDLGPITENPNRRQDALDAWDRNLISNDAARRDLGFSDGDAPDDDEVLQRFALRVGMNPDGVPMLLKAIMSLTGQIGTVIEHEAEVAQTPALPLGAPGQPGAGEAPKPQTSPGQGTPNGGTPASGGVQASGAVQSATGGWVISENLCRRLAETEQRVVDRVLAAAEPVIARAVERAGARARSSVRAVQGRQGDQWRAAIEGLDAADVVPALAAVDAFSLGLEEQRIVAEAWAPLEQRYRDWVARAVDDEVRTALQILDPSPNAWVGLGTPGRPPRNEPGSGQRRHERRASAARGAQRATKAMKARIDASWQRMSDELTAAATRQLYKPGQLDVPTRGEAPDTVLSPDAIAEALDVVGGAERGGLAGGDLARMMTEQGARDAGHEWVYGLADRATFPQHMALDGTRFTRWDDGALSTAFTGAEWVGPFFHPRDHKGCGCREAKLYAVQSNPDLFDVAPDQSRAAEIDAALRRLYNIDTDRSYA